MQIVFVIGVGALGVLLILGAIFLLNKEDSPEERDKKVKNQIIEEMLANAGSEEERARILAIAEAEAGQEDVLAPEPDAEEDGGEEHLYGIDEESGDTLDKMIASQLRENASAGIPRQDEAADEEYAEDEGLESVLALVNERSEKALEHLAQEAGLNNGQQEADAENEGYKTGLFAYDNMGGEEIPDEDFLTATQSLDIPDTLKQNIDRRIKGIEGDIKNDGENGTGENSPA